MIGMLEKINLGFNQYNSLMIYENLHAYLTLNREKILFQMHPLGFKYFKLGNISKEVEFRLHYWVSTNEKHDNDLQIHDHSFDFDSFVVNGSITNNKYEIVNSYNPKVYIYDVKFKNEKSKLILNSDNCYISKIQSVNINQGGFYRMLSNEFHESINNEEETVTLLKISKLESKTARVFSPKKLGTLSRFERKFLSADENNKLIDRIIHYTQNIK